MASKTILGAIAGDIIGSVYEWHNIKTVDFPLFSNFSRFTDDTVLTVAVANAILQNADYGVMIKKYARKYPKAGYGGNFKKWFKSDNMQAYNSYGNGSAMRVSPVGFAFDTIEDTLNQAKLSAEVTHNHPEGIKGAQAVAAAIFYARNGKSKQQIKNYIIDKFAYNLDFKIDEIRPKYKFDVSCQGSVPQAIVAFLESKDYENAVRLAVSIGGDSDTIACIAGSIASAFYKDIPQHIIKKVYDIIPNEFINIIEKFESKYPG
ncbi:MAG: ADP-ribosylglycohydrolase family protein [Marinilabiliales bacterium]